MYFWNLTALLKELRKGKISQNDVLPYLLVAATLWCCLPLIMPPNDYVGVGLTLLWTLLMIGFSYYWNQQIDKKDFLIRYMTLSWVVSIRYLVFVLPALLLIIVAQETLLMMGYEFPPLYYADYYQVQDVEFEIILMGLYLAYFYSAWGLLKK